MSLIVRKFRESLGVQVFSAFTALIVIISFSFILFFVNRQHTVMISAWEENGRLLAKILAYQSRIGVFSENEEILRAPMESTFQHATVLEANVYNAGGTSIARRVRYGNGTIGVKENGGNSSNAADRDVIDSISGPNNMPVYHLENAMAVWAPVMSESAVSIEDDLYFDNPGPEEDNLPMGYVRIVLDKTPFQALYRSVVVKTVLIGAGFLILGALVTWALAIRISRPLRQLTDGISRFGREEARGELPVGARNEIGNVARTFEKMADNLEHREKEKQQLEMQLRQTQKMEAIGTLAGGIAHDFNNILGIISGYTELATLDAAEGSRSQKCLKEIFTAGQRARDLVQQILTFSRQGTHEPKPLQIGFAVKEVMKMLRATLPTTIEVKYTVPTKLPAVIADPTQIHQVVMNLCTNASHAMRQNGGRLEVILEEVMVDEVLAGLITDLMPGHYQRLRVRDTGHGMPPEIVERIFDPFFSTKEPGEGTGLGLSVVHGIVKKCGGGIEVTSVPGEGTTFDVYLPSLEEEEESSIEEALPLPTGTEKILLVDDEAAMVEMGRQMLESLGYKVTAETSSVEALEIFKSRPEAFDLVMTDMTMPKMTGAEFSGAVLKIRSDIPIILCTGYSERIHEDTAKAIGVREFVLKPVVLREIAQVIRRALEGVRKVANG
jgi:signal transduction histidine kinase/ActR/RegA family two-component response regulator